MDDYAGANSSKQFAADVNGDKKADSITYYKDTGTWYVALSNGSIFQPYTQWIDGFGIGSKNQFIGDVNGDKLADAVVYSEQDVSWNGCFIERNFVYFEGQMDARPWRRINNAILIGR